MILCTNIYHCYNIVMCRPLLLHLLLYMLYYSLILLFHICYFNSFIIILFCYSLMILRSVRISGDGTMCSHDVLFNGSIDSLKVRISWASTAVLSSTRSVVPMENKTTMILINVHNINIV